MQKSDARRVLFEEWDTVDAASLEQAVAVLMEENGGEDFLTANSWMLDEPRQLAIHEFDRTEVRLVPWRGQMIKLRWSVVSLLCEINRH